MRFSILSIFVSTAALALGPACGDNGGGPTSATTSSDSDASTASTTESMSGTMGSTTSTGDVDPTGGDPVTSTSTTGAVDPPTTGDSTTGDSTTGDSTTADSTTADSTTADSTTGDSATDDSTTDDSTTGGIGGEANVLYVRDDGQDGNPGTVDLPLRTIQWALVKAQQQPGVDTIRVAEGDYASDYANDDHIVMVEGVSLVGGYRADWGARDPAQYVTHVVDVSPDAVPSSEANPHRAIELPAGLTAATALDGFHVRVAQGLHRAAVFVRGGGTIRDNVLEPVVAPGAVLSFGARIYQASPTLVANRIRFDVEQGLGQAMGVKATASSGLFAANVIDLSGVQTDAYGMWLEGGAAEVLGNSIYAPEGGSTYALFLIGSTTPTLDNNLLTAVDDASICIFLSGAAAIPNAVRNNVLGCHYTLRGNSQPWMWTTVAELEGGLANAADNLKPAQPVVQPGDDLMLDAQSPCTVTQGGRDILGDVPDDIDGLPRTLPLSIGAHEWDGGCQ